MNISKFRKIILWTVVSLFFLLVLSRITLPYAVQYSFSNWFQQQGIDAYIDDVSFDLYKGGFSLQGINATKGGIQVLALSDFSIRWSWSAMSDNHARILSISLGGLDVGIEKNKNGDTVIAGLNLSDLSKDPEDSPAIDESGSGSTPVNWLVQLDRLNLSKFNICFNDETASNLDYCARFDEMQWDGEIRFDLSQATDTVVPLFTKGSYTLGNLQVHNNKLNRNLLDIKLLTLNAVTIDTSDNINIDSISLRDTRFLQRVTDNNQKQVTRFDELNLDLLSLSQLNQLHVKSIEVINHQILLVVSQDKELEINEWLPKSTAQDSQPTEETASGTPFIIAIDSIKYKTGQTTQFIDNSLAEPFSVTLNNIDLSVNDIDSSKPEQQSRVIYSATHNEHGKINLEGTVTPFSLKPSFNIDGKISGVDLRSVSTFTKGTIGHSIKSGQLDATLELIAEKSVLDSKLDLSLFHFELKALSKKDAEKLDADLGLPLNTSLMLLKDKDNSIHLTIPITGDLANPNFEPHDVINTALTKAITAAILNFYTPYGIADTLFSLATALRFDPVNFDAGSSKPDDTAIENTNKIAELMIERPGIHITLCGFTNSADRAILFPDTATKKNEEDFTPEEQHKIGLSDLTDARYSALKKIFIAKKIDASRLVACEPEHDEGNGLSGIEISI